MYLPLMSSFVELSVVVLTSVELLVCCGAFGCGLSFRCLLFLFSTPSFSLELISQS